MRRSPTSSDKAVSQTAPTRNRLASSVSLCMYILASAMLPCAEASSGANATREKPEKGLAAKLRQRSDDMAQKYAHLLTPRCSHHRPGRTLTSCANLSPAGTGTTTLSTAFNLSGAPYVHSHTRHPADIHASDGTLCFVTTFRDPASRLISFLASGAVGNGMPVPLLMARLKNGSLQMRTSGFNAGAGFYYRSQLEHLEGLDCGQMEFHVLCTCSLTSDWKALREMFGPHDWGGALLTLDNISKNKHSRTSYRKLQFTRDDVAYIRQALYPSDTRLYQQYCTC